LEQSLWKYLKSTDKPIVLYGMGNGADKIISVLESYGIPFKGIFASDGFVRNKTFHGFKISSLKELEDTLGDMIILLCFGSERPEVIEFMSIVQTIIIPMIIKTPSIPMPIYLRFVTN